MARKLLNVTEDLRIKLDLLKYPNESYDKFLRRTFGLDIGRSRGRQRK